MEVDIIFTFDDTPQQRGSCSINTETLDNKKEFFRAVTSCLEDEEKATLVKVSCCVHGASIPSPDHWYLKSNGKFWDDEIPQLIEELWWVKSMITPVN